MISDLELLRLNNLVASGLASGISPELAMQPLQHEIERNPVRAMDIEFDAGCSESPVESHLLLHPASPLSRHLRSAYAGISGSGTYYNGMFGHGQSLLDAVRYSSAVDDIKQPDRPPGPISEQVLLCVRLLGMSNVTLMQEAASSVRRHLSGIMLDYPVLLHPSILVPNLAAMDRRPSTHHWRAHWPAHHPVACLGTVISDHAHRIRKGALTKHCWIDSPHSSLRALGVRLGSCANSTGPSNTMSSASSNQEDEGNCCDL